MSMRKKEGRIVNGFDTNRTIGETEGEMARFELEGETAVDTSAFRNVRGVGRFWPVALGDSMRPSSERN